MTSSSIYGGKDAREVPMYGFAEAAALLRVPVSTLRSWTVGQHYRVRGGQRRFKPPIPIVRDQRLLTFYDLVEAYVLSSMRRDFNVELPVIRTSVDYVRDHMDIRRPLLSQDFYTDGVSLLVEKWGTLVDASRQGQLAMQTVVMDSLKRIERDAAGLVQRLYPWRVSVDEERVIELDPRRALGRAVVVGTSISIDVLRSRHRAGDSVKRLAKTYTLDESKVAAVVAWDGQRAA